MQTLDDFKHDLKWSMLTVSSTDIIEAVYNHVDSKTFATCDELEADHHILYHDASLIECITIIDGIKNLDDLFQHITTKLNGALYYLATDDQYALAVQCYDTW